MLRSQWDLSLAAVAAALACSSVVALHALLIALTIGRLPSKRKHAAEAATGGGGSGSGSGRGDKDRDGDR